MACDEIKRADTDMSILSTTRTVLLGGLPLLALSACVTHQPLMYGWGDYQQEVYQYFKADGSKSAEEQILAMQEAAQKASARGEKLPPGYHAHLALLYASTGKEDLAIAQLETEKTQFPESASYMDFLMRKYKK